jgi:hypothetical protein
MAISSCQSPGPPAAPAPFTQDALTNFTAKWSASEIKANDPVAAAVIANSYGLANAFWWSHHTFTHENLDNATSFDARAQIELNMVMAVGAKEHTQLPRFRPHVDQPSGR